MARTSHDDLKWRIFAHRGLWANSTLDQNSKLSIIRAIEAGFSVEIDLRDQNGEIVLSHGPTQLDENYSTLYEVLKLERHSQILAMNVKSDGLFDIGLSEILALLEIDDFFFDMSKPEEFKYLSHKARVALRVSDLGEGPNLEQRDGPIWLDSFYGDWFVNLEPSSFTATKSLTVVVSPELHGRNPARAWKWFADNLRLGHNLAICTDHPFEILESLSS